MARQIARGSIVALIAVSLVFLSTSFVLYAEEQERLTVVVGQWGGAATVEWNEAIRQRFREAHPEYDVEFRILASNIADANAQLLVQLAAGVGPDLILIGAGQALTNWYIPGLIRPIDDLVERDGFDVGAFLPHTLHFAYYEGKLMGVPRSTVSSSLGTNFSAYNRRLLDEVGLVYPDNSWTFDDVLQYAKKLTIDVDGDGTPDQWGVVADSGSWATWAWSGGAKITPDDDETKLILLDDPHAADGMDFLVSLRHTHKVMAPTGNGLGPFRNQRAAMALNSVSTTGSDKWYLNFPELDWAFVGNPRGPNSDAGYATMASHILGINAAISEERVEAAWTLMKFLSSHDHQEFEYYELEWGTPHLTSLVHSDRFIHLNRPPWSYAPLLEAKTRFNPRHVNWPEFSSAVGQLYQQAYQNGGSVKNLLEENRSRLISIWYKDL